MTHFSNLHSSFKELSVFRLHKNSRNGMIQTQSNERFINTSQQAPLLDLLPALWNLMPMLVCRSPRLSVGHRAVAEIRLCQSQRLDLRAPWYNTHTRKLVYRGGGLSAKGAPQGSMESLMVSARIEQAASMQIG